MIILQIILAHILTVFVYLAFPVIYVRVKGKVPSKKAHKLALINSIVLGLSFSILGLILDLEPSAGTMFAAAFAYYFIAKVILTDKNSYKNNTNQEHTNNNVQQSTNQNEFHLDNALKEKYSKMFNMPFDNVICCDKIFINGYECLAYTFNPFTSDFLSIGKFAYMLEVKTKTPRYFASEYFYNNTYILCEWEFEGENKTGHLNYGEVASSLSDAQNHRHNIKKKLQEILK